MALLEKCINLDKKFLLFGQKRFPTPECLTDIACAFI